MTEDDVKNIIYRHAGIRGEQSKEKQLSESDIVVSNVSKEIRKDIDRVPKYLAYSFIFLFIISNLLIALLIAVAFCYDVYFVGLHIELKNAQPYVRIIDTGLIKSLVTGVTIQIGIATLIMTRYYYNINKSVKKVFDLKIDNINESN